MGAGDLPSGREVILEYQTVGDSVRVAAVDVQTGEEVVIFGPANTAQFDLQRLALRKLANRLADLNPETKTPRRGGRGVVV